MSRPPRFEYPGAIYHVMARGDGGKKIFIDKEDCESFLHWLEHVCLSRGWRIHAWVLMGNHFHLLLETPESNLVSGMQLLLGSFSQAWNVRKSRRGHVFQGRYKSVPITGGGAADAHYFKSVADYIHLNPARAKLAGGSRGALVNYQWSSMPSYAKGKSPEWQPHSRVLDAFRLSHDRRGRKAYVGWLEERARDSNGKVNDEAMKAIRRGWYLGEETFKDKLLGLLDRKLNYTTKSNSLSGAALWAHHEGAAKRLIERLSDELDMPMSKQELKKIRKGDARKVLCAALVKSNTSVSNQWITERLEMGHPASMSQIVNRLMKSPEGKKNIRKYEKILKSKD